MTDDHRSGRVVLCTYRVMVGMEEQFERLLAQHGPTLRRLGLVTNTPSQILCRRDGAGLVYVEIFEWTSDDAATKAAEVPDVIAVWEPMAALCEARDGLPGLEFPLFDRIGPRA